MNAFQTCRNTSDAVPLYLPLKLYLKPAARLNISIQLPNVKKLEKSISHWEIMEKLKTLIRPDEFSVLKVSKTTIEFVRFEAEVENKTRLDKVLSKLDNNSFKLKEIPDFLRLKATEIKSDFPTRQKWDAFFNEAKDMDETKAGLRPDTIHLSNLPIKWFVPQHSINDEDVSPSEKLFYRIFEKFGPIRYVDIPICDPYRKKMKEQISGIKTLTFDDKEFFEGYVQFKDYLGFTKTMDEFRGMKLLRKEDDETFCVNIKVDFDRTKHLSDASIRRREIVRDRLVKKQGEKEEKEKKELETKRKNERDERTKEIDKKAEKEQRRNEREAKRKAKLMEKLKVGGCDDDEINEKIAKEEKKLLQVQRKLEAIRLVDELFRRIKDKKDELHHNAFNTSKDANNEQLQRYKNMSELAVLTQRQNLHHALEGRVVLKTILSKKKKKKNRDSSDSDSSLSLENGAIVNKIQPDIMYDPNWFAYSYPGPLYPASLRGAYHLYPTRGRFPRASLPGSSRGRHRGRNYRSRYRGGYRGNYTQHYSPEVEEQYYKYFSKFYSEHDTRSRSRSRSRRRSRSYSRSRTRSRSYTPRRSRSRNRSRRSRSRNRSRRSRTPEKRKKKSRSASVDSSKFISPRSLRRARSKSWSTPKTTDNKRSWSKSP